MLYLISSSCTILLYLYKKKITHCVLVNDDEDDIKYANVIIFVNHKIDLMYICLLN